jgi:hypothetical protein
LEFNQQKKKNMKKYYMISCKEATYLVCLKEENKLSIIKSFKLKLHLAICILCKRFKLQTEQFSRMSKHLEDQSNDTMSKDKKSEIKQLISELSGYQNN